MKWDHIKDNPFRQVKRLKVDATDPPTCPSRRPTGCLEACREDRNLYTFTALGLNTGMRIGEVVETLTFGRPTAQNLDSRADGQNQAGK